MTPPAPAPSTTSTIDPKTLAAIDAIAKITRRSRPATIAALTEYADDVGSMLNAQLERDLSGQERSLMATLRAAGFTQARALRKTLAERHRGRAATRAEHAIVTSESTGRGPAGLAWAPTSAGGKRIAMSDLLPRRPDATAKQLAASVLDKTGLQRVVNEHFSEPERDTFYMLTSAKVSPARAFLKTMGLHRPAPKGDR